MSYLSEAHRDWHVVNGANNTMCPLDCMAGVQDDYLSDQDIADLQAEDEQDYWENKDEYLALYGPPPGDF